jgi:hypothetical protein
MRSAYLFLASLVLMSSVSWAAAPAKPLKVFGIYSDLTFNGEGGDLLGMDVLIVPAEATADLRWRAFVQIAEGGAPYCAVVFITVIGSKIEFTLPPGDIYGGMRFAGTISNDEIRLLTPSGQVEHLRRGKSYWQGT